jgi:hypothetical protein
MGVTTGSRVRMSNATMHFRLPWHGAENIPMHVVDVLRGM